MSYALASPSAGIGPDTWPSAGSCCAIQSGALPPVPTGQPPPDLVQNVYRWIDTTRTHTAVPAVTGYRPARWHVSWAPGTVLRVEIGDPSTTPLTGKGPHLPPVPLIIPPGATQLLGTGI